MKSDPCDLVRALLPSPGHCDRFLILDPRHVQSRCTEPCLERCVSVRHPDRDAGTSRRCPLDLGDGLMSETAPSPSPPLGLLLPFAPSGFPGFREPRLTEHRAVGTQCDPRAFSEPLTGPGSVPARDPGVSALGFRGAFPASGRLSTACTHTWAGDREPSGRKKGADLLCPSQR